MYVIIGRDQCNFCEAAKDFLRGVNLPYIEYNVQDIKNRWLLSLIRQAGHKTVPQIFAPDGRYIGGYAELKKDLT